VNTCAAATLNDPLSQLLRSLASGPTSEKSSFFAILVHYLDFLADLFAEVY
jgi:hypothetical protein